MPGLPPPMECTILDGPLADIVRRINLTMPQAIQTSGELWPDRKESLPDIPEYLKWHKVVRPGGTGHPSTISSGIPGLSLRATSVEGLAQRLIEMLDRFHYSQICPDSLDVDEIFDAPEAAGTSIILSLEVFFRRLRCYLV
jgi:hypothetical protein